MLLSVRRFPFAIAYIPFGCFCCLPTALIAGCGGAFTSCRLFHRHPPAYAQPFHPPHTFWKDACLACRRFQRLVSFHGVSPVCCRLDARWFGYHRGDILTSIRCASLFTVTPFAAVYLTGLNASITARRCFCVCRHSFCHCVSPLVCVAPICWRVDPTGRAPVIWLTFPVCRRFLRFIAAVILQRTVSCCYHSFAFSVPLIPPRGCRVRYPRTRSAFSSSLRFRFHTVLRSASILPSTRCLLLTGPCTPIELLPLSHA